MRAAKKDEAKPVAPEQEEGEGVDELLEKLHSHDGSLREHARRQLITLGEVSVFPLMDALEDPDWHVRWEAAKALQALADPRAAPALVRALRDRRFGVRWLAADALIALQEAPLPVLLHALVEQGDSVMLRNGAHRVLRELSKAHANTDLARILEPVIEALESIEPSVTVPMAAQKAFGELPKRILE
jgi:HEAT repeat protein